MARKAAIYARFSSHRQHEESIDTQIDICTSKAASMGATVVATYADRAISGRSAEKRPQFLQMVSDAKRGNFDLLIVYKYDRFSRNRYDAAVYKSKLRKSGVELVSATEGVPEGPEGIILESVLEGLAEYYSANLGATVRDHMRERAQECRHNGQKVFGYTLGSDKYYHIDEGDADGVRLAFSMAVDGHGKTEIAKALNAGGWKTVNGREWTVTKITRLLENRRYMGEYRWGDVIVPGGMPRIVSDDVWEEANRSAKGRPRAKADKRAPYLLTGLIFDRDGKRYESNCGRGRDGTYRYYYRVKETGASIRRDDVENRVRGAVSRLMTCSPELENSIVNMVMECQERMMADEFAAIRMAKKRLEETEREQGNLIDLAARMGASDKIAAKLSDLEREASSLESEIAELERGTPTIEPDMVRYLLSRIRKCDGPDAVVRGFVKRVIVDGDDVRVFFTVGGSRPPGKESADGDYELDGLGKSHGGAPIVHTACPENTRLFRAFFTLPVHRDTLPGSAHRYFAASL